MKQINGKALSLILFFYFVLGQALAQEARPENSKLKIMTYEGREKFFQFLAPKIFPRTCPF